MANLDLVRGRSTVLNLQNQSGATRSPGDVVVMDSSNNEAFTTSTTSNTTLIVGVVDESIGISSNGRVVVGGYARNVKTLGTAARGDYLFQSTTVATAAHLASGTPIAGAFGYVLKGGSGTAATAHIFPTDPGAVSGSSAVATDPIWDAAGDLAVGTGANTAGRLAIGAAGKVPESNGTTLVYDYPPGYEYNYVQITAAANITATTEATANTVATATATAFDGSTIVLIEFYCPWARPDITARTLNIYLYDDTGGGAASIGRVAALIQEGSVNNQFTPVYTAYRVTPSNATHTYSIRAAVGNAVGGVVNAGAGGLGNDMPAFIRITKV